MDAKTGNTKSGRLAIATFEKRNALRATTSLGGIELRALRKLKREEIESRFIFMTERAAPRAMPRLGEHVPRRARRSSRVARRSSTRPGSKPGHAMLPRC
jgi:hypothetical protein